MMNGYVGKTYYVTLVVPVEVTCSVTSETIVEAMAAAIEQISNDGLEAYHMDYDVMDQGVVKRVEEV
jgi:hypothetical protein